MKDRNKFSNKNPIFYLAMIDTKGLFRDAIIVVTLNIVSNKTTLDKVKHVKLWGKVILSKFGDQNKLLSPLVISTAEKIISICNNEN